MASSSSDVVVPHDGGVVIPAAAVPDDQFGGCTRCTPQNFYRLHLDQQEAGGSTVQLVQNVLTAEVVNAPDVSQAVVVQMCLYIVDGRSLTSLGPSMHHTPR